MTIESVTRIAETWLNQHSGDCPLQIVRVQIEDDLALVFYNSRSGELIAGNAPLLIDAKTGALHLTGTGGSMTTYVENFRITGDPHVAPIAFVRITGGGESADKSAALTGLKEATDLGLVGAKTALDAVLKGEVVEVLPRKGGSAPELCARLEAAGWIATVVRRAP